MDESTTSRLAAPAGNVLRLPEAATAEEFQTPVGASASAHRDENFGKMQLSESVAAHLREQIISGKLRQGAFLRIDAIAKALGTSTTPVREGLLLLQSESFVRLLPRRGFVVNSFSKGDLLDMFWAQATVGAELAARAAMRMSDADIARLERLEADHQKAFALGDQDIVTRLGHEFHRSINLAAQSPRLALQLGNLARQLPNRFYTSIEGQLKGAIEYHPIIINAISVRDQEAVRSLMFRHIISGGEHLIAMLERQGAWDSVSAPVEDRSGALASG
ncbi:GntR family transcriptional regulator [Caballeronia hypogeia]|uniref:GntR family transcriptional regulator n=1 Tax=Caballeronia hypogeia TaxID=1777140 RepID=A0A158DNG5_9BURK|nr:GntR family transcriptional regulator [Caballeronia hypogeia]SAK96138.1 GntR family transcriptional regulator [Caballeronia hypogeia]